MWRALRAELAYSRSWLVGAFGVAVGVALILTVMLFAVGEDGPLRKVAGLRAMFLIMAPLIVSFIVQALRAEEGRARLLLAGPLTPKQIAGATVLLPIVLCGIGVAAAGVWLGAEALVGGVFETKSLHLAGYVGGLNLMIQMMSLLAQEAAAAHRQGRRSASAAGWAGFVAAVLALATLSAISLVQGPLGWPSAHAGNLVVVLMAMGATVALYASRRDFTT